MNSINPLIEKSLSYIEPRDEKLFKKIERLDKVIITERNEKLRLQHIQNREELSFRLVAGFKAKFHKINPLIKIKELSNEIQWFQIREASKIWTFETGEFKTEVTKVQRFLGNFLFGSAYTFFIVGAYHGAMARIWDKSPDFIGYFLTAVFCFAIGFVPLWFSFRYIEAARIQDKIEKEKPKKHKRK